MRKKIREFLASTSSSFSYKCLSHLSMVSSCHPKNLFSLLIFYCCSVHFGTCRHIISSSQFIKDPENLSSNDGMFELGFFSPENSTSRFVGIWHVSKSRIIWVANRNQPLNDSYGVVKLSDDGNLVVENGQQHIVWSSNVSSTIASNTSAQLLNTGNLALSESNSGSIIWQSFQHQSNTFLPKMTLGTNTRTGEKVKLTSWKSPSDPSVGDFSLSLERLNTPEAFIWNGSHPYWRSGPWNGQAFLGIPGMVTEYLDGFDLEREEGNVYLTDNFADNSELIIFVLNSQGKLEQTSWDSMNKEWNIDGTLPESECDVYGKCGAFGSCNSDSWPICTCLRGFKPRNREEWDKQIWTSGCVRRKPLQCENEAADAGKKDGFLKLPMMKVPDFAQWSSNFDVDCRTQCLENCTCKAYAYDSGIGCMLWSGDLIDLQRFPNTAGIDLYVRVAHSELDYKRISKVIITVAIVLGMIIAAACSYFLWKLTKGRDFPLKIKWQQFVKCFNTEPTGIHRKSQIGDLSQVKLQDLSLYDLEELATATNNFDSANKLGQGGFGPVYKGLLQDGQEVAVKRLSKASGQGQEEFMNEMVVISKLQHRNLVRLLGCCIEGDERMLIYEYMPSKSLDAYIFDMHKQRVLDWKQRFNIIEGIARGLVYLHRDSRLKIIHRDLKLSNILLDEELNPKISDFGMAKIFKGCEYEANTGRIVRTYGYMSPEYVIQGIFSEKSDIFSFGVLLLEIVSGRKNTSFYEDVESLSLLGFAWKLWNEDKATYLIDPEISDLSNENDILRCIHIGLLCVQELARDRPSMPTVISMLNSEIADLPPTKQPAFIQRQALLDAGSSQKLCSLNNVTLSNLQGR